MTETRDFSQAPPAHRSRVPQAAGADGSPRKKAGVERRDLPTRSRSWVRMGAAVVFIAACVVAAVLAYERAGGTTAVIVLNNDVERGQVIERSDLVSKQVSGVDGVPVEDVDTVMGQTATVDMLAGQILTRGHLAAEDPLPGKGEALAGMSLTASQAPDGLTAGDPVRVVAVPTAGADPTSTRNAEPEVLVEEATVYSVQQSSGAGEQIIRLTVIVPDADADVVATYEAVDQAAVVEIGSGDR